MAGARHTIDSARDIVRLDAVRAFGTHHLAPPFPGLAVRRAFRRRQLPTGRFGSNEVTCAAKDARKNKLRSGVHARFQQRSLTMTIEVVKGQEATIEFDAKKCIHSRNCVLSHPDVFVPNVQGDWIRPDAQPVEELMHLGKNCPSGAIRVTRNAPIAGAAAHSDAPPLVNTVRVRENGPLALEADMQIGGVVQSAVRATLCRCGLSANKPYCDGSHTAGAFVATGEPVSASFEALVARDGPLNVQPRPNGPLRVSGNLELVSGTGRTFNKLTDAFLCRCGHSQNKPYCDGSHKAAGFVAD
jgi:CDGSH-type Zn-finger protein/uncharacterized Fe-S cluster protein YjdI